MHLRTNSVWRTNYFPKAHMKSYWLDDKRRRKLAVHWITWEMCDVYATICYTPNRMAHIQMYTSYHHTQRPFQLLKHLRKFVLGNWTYTYTLYDVWREVHIWKCIKYAWNGNDGYKFARSLNYDGWMCRHTCISLQIKYVEKISLSLLAHAKR